MNNNQNFVATMFEAIFPLLNTAQVYVSGIYMSKDTTSKAFYEAFKECRDKLETGPKYNLDPEYYIEQFKNWAKQGEEIIFMSLLNYHPERFYPQQIEDMPEASEFWEGMYQKEQWDLYEHPFFDSWLQEAQEITYEMWQEH